MRKQRKVGIGGARPRRGSGARGITLIEVTIAMAVLTIGMLGSMTLILAAMQTNSRSRTDTTGAVLDQEVIELFATLKNYPKTGFVQIPDCSTNAAVEASLVQGAGPTGAGATVYTTSTAPTADKVGDIDWTQATPTLATSSATGYAMKYRTCTGDMYEVRWNVMEVSPNPNSRLSLLTVSSRQIGAQSAQSAGYTPILYAPATTVRTLIEN